LCDTRRIISRHRPSQRQQCCGLGGGGRGQDKDGGKDENEKEDKKEEERTSEMDTDVIEGEGKGVEEEGDLNANAPDGTSTDGGPSFEGVVTSPGGREGANVQEEIEEEAGGGFDQWGG